MLKQSGTNRLLPQDRILLLDVVRGTAILGILLMNMQSYAMVSAVYSNPFAAGIPGRQEYSLWLAVHILVDQKFLTLLAILFGAGIVLLGDRLEARGQAVDPIMRRRMIWLMIFGLMHAYLIWYGDILFAYGLCGLVAMQFRTWPPRRLFLVAGAVLGLSIAVSVTFGLTYHLWPESVRQSGLAAWQPSAQDLTAEVAAYRGGYLSELSYRWRQASLLGRSYMPVMLGIRALVGMLLGMGLLKLHFFDLRRSGSRHVRLILAGLGLGMPLVALGVITNTRHGWAYPYALFFGSQFNNVGSLCVALGYLGLLSLLVRQYGQSLASRVLQAVGRTALSNYLLQSILCTLVFYGIGFGLFERLSRLQQLAGVIFIWLFEAALSVLWLRYRQYGPLEWLWRRLTYGSAWARREKDYRQPTGVSYCLRRRSLFVCRWRHYSYLQSHEPITACCDTMRLFHLTKWYLDCVTDQGNLLIGYAAMLRLGILRLPLVGSFSLIDGHIINSADMVVRWHKPVVADGQVSWDCPTMRVAGSWRTQTAPIRSVLLQQNDGQVTWECLQPRATASLRINGRPLEGDGYVECLDMDIPLWRLGLKRLVWGRYVSADDSLVWIDWQGAVSLTRVWHGSDIVAQASIHSDRIDLLSEGCLTLQDTITLREGPIETTVLKHMPVVRRVLPGWLRHIDEHKWLSRGLLTSGNQTSTGWVIHEAVTFGD